MFDSIRFHIPLSFPINIDSDGWDFHLKRLKSGKIIAWYEYRGDGFPTYTLIKYYPESTYNGRPVLIVTIGSVQKLVFGNNFQTCTDISVIIQKLNDHLRQIDGLGNIDTGEGRIRMIDFCANYKLGTSLPILLQILLNKRNPHRKFRSFDDALGLPHKKEKLVKGGRINGISFPSVTATTSFYDKYKECKDPRAVGIVRHELRLEKYRTIKLHTMLADPKIKDMTSEIAIRILTEDLQQIGLDKDIPTEQSVRQQLIEKHKLSKGQKLYTQLLNLKECPSLTTKGIIEYTGFSSSKVSRMKKDLADAGVSWDLSPATIVFPKLEVKYEGEYCKNDIKVLSDTSSNLADPLSDGGSEIVDGSCLQTNPTMSLLQRVTEMTNQLIEKSKSAPRFPEPIQSEVVVINPQPTSQMVSENDGNSRFAESTVSAFVEMISDLICSDISTADASDQLQEEHSFEQQVQFSFDDTVFSILKQLTQEGEEIPGPVVGEIVEDQLSSPLSIPKTSALRFPDIELIKAENLAKL